MRPPREGTVLTAAKDEPGRTLVSATLGDHAPGGNGDDALRQDEHDDGPGDLAAERLDDLWSVQALEEEIARDLSDSGEWEGGGDALKPVRKERDGNDEAAEEEDDTGGELADAAC